MRGASPFSIALTSAYILSLRRSSSLSYLAPPENLFVTRIGLVFECNLKLRTAVVEKKVTLRVVFSYD